jgi:hypothetical protein
MTFVTYSIGLLFIWLKPPCPGTAQLKIIPSLACLNILSKYTASYFSGMCSATSSDITLIPQLSILLSDKTVASFGDGPGVYKREIEKLGHVKLYDAFDGAPYCEETSHGRVRFMDLSIPLMISFNVLISLSYNCIIIHLNLIYA